MGSLLLPRLSLRVDWKLCLFDGLLQHYGAIKKANGKSEGTFSLNENKNTAHQILWNAAKAVFREKCIALNPYLKKTLGVL